LIEPEWMDERLFIIIIIIIIILAYNQTIKHANLCNTGHIEIKVPLAAVAT
jgi:hypothetical protein